MEIIITSPNFKNMVTKKQIARLNDVGKVIIYGSPILFTKIPQLFKKTYINSSSGKQANKQLKTKILAIDPDFCEWKVPDNIIVRLQGIKAICLQTTSFNWLNTDLLAKHQIPVTNVAKFSTLSVAEWAVMQMFCLARKIPLVAKSNWGEDYDLFRGIELYGKTIGIVGLGSIGTRIAEICQGLGMKVLYWSRLTRDDRYIFTPLNQLLKTADVIFPALLKNPQTNNILTDDLLKSMKSSALFISIVHSIYNHDLVVKMVQNNQLAGYAFEQNGGKVFHKYKGNIWAGPALAWVTTESIQRNFDIWVENIIQAVHGNFPNKIN